MGIHAYFKSLSDLEQIERCPGKFKFQGHNVAAHSFKVTKIIQFLGTVEELHGQTIDWKVLYEKALNHDYSELFLGDIKTPVKYARPDLRKLLSIVEEEMVQEFVITEFPSEFQEIYLNRFKEGKDDTLEGKLLAVADKIDLLYESFEELNRGNPDEIFVKIYKDALQNIVLYKDLPSVQYFLNHVLVELMDDTGTSPVNIQEVTNEILREFAE